MGAVNGHHAGSDVVAVRTVGGPVHVQASLLVSRMLACEINVIISAKHTPKSAELSFALSPILLCVPSAELSRAEFTTTSTTMFSQSAAQAGYAGDVVDGLSGNNYLIYFIISFSRQYS